MAYEAHVDPEKRIRQLREELQKVKQERDEAVEENEILREIVEDSGVDADEIIESKIGDV